MYPCCSDFSQWTNAIAFQIAHYHIRNSIKCFVVDNNEATNEK